MRRAIHKLTLAVVERKSKRPGLHSDGGGLAFAPCHRPRALGWLMAARGARRGEGYSDWHTADILRMSVPIKLRRNTCVRLMKTAIAAPTGTRKQA
jgi:hypothetical protein